MTGPGLRSTQARALKSLALARASRPGPAFASLRLGNGVEDEQELSRKGVGVISLLVLSLDEMV